MVAQWLALLLHSEMVDLTPTWLGPFCMEFALVILNCLYV